jgi:DNA-binding winged helix-turn-helix (wHTH) protein
MTISRPAVAKLRTFDRGRSSKSESAGIDRQPTSSGVVPDKAAVNKMSPPNEGQERARRSAAAHAELVIVPVNAVQDRTAIVAWISRLPPSRRTAPSRLPLAQERTADAGAYVRLDRARGIAWQGDRRLIVSRPGYLLLECLANRLGATVSFDEIKLAVWGTRERSDSTLRALVHHSRTALGETSSVSINVVRMVGYRLVGHRPAAIEMMALDSEGPM